jgi:pimeloyl-ACP methyl ester carboxylesterase
MPTLTTDDGVRLHYEEAGSGVPLVFVHEFAGDLRSWELQMQYFSRLYRCIAYNARGYPPSEVPQSVDRYSQDRARDDIRAVLDALGIDKAHIVGLSMGAFATLHFGMRYPERALSLTIAGGGYGSHPAQYEKFQTDAKANAQLIRDKGMAYFAANYGHPTRIQLKNKDPRGYAHYVRPARGAFGRGLGEHDARLPGATAFALCADGGDEEDPGADTDPGRRRRGAVPRSVPADETLHSESRSRAAAEERAHDQPGRAGALQPPDRGFPAPGAGRPLDRARSARRAAFDLGSGRQAVAFARRREVQVSKLAVRDIRVRAVSAPMKRPLKTSIAAVSVAPLC